MDKELAECFGLWFAEGDSVTKYEINFCNSELSLIKYFDNVVRTFIGDFSYNFRLYCYSKKGGDFLVPLNDVYLRFYQDIRARRPYYIWRVASVELVKHWKLLFDEIILVEKYYSDFIRGFFAGEGFVKFWSHHSRKLTIAQKERVLFIENMFDYLGLTYRFWPNQRIYEFTGKRNWDIFNQYGLASLHSSKKIKFTEYYSSYKQDHYPRGSLKSSVFEVLIVPYSSKELVRTFNRSPARIYDVLSELKQTGLVQDYRINSNSYWIRVDTGNILLSSSRNEILGVLDSGLTLKSIAVALSKHISSIRKQLFKLEKLKLVILRDKLWYKTNKKYLVIS